MLRVNPKQITLAREARGLTQAQLSKMLPSLNQGNLSKIEKGIFDVSDKSLNLIAQVLNFPTTFFTQEDVRPAISNLYYRKQYKVSGKTLKTLRAIISILTRAIGALMEEVDMARQYEKLRFDIQEGWTPQKAAIITREVLGIPHGPIDSITAFIERAGIIVHYLNYDIPGFDGVAAITENGWPILFLNSNKPNDRKRMNLAHELAHVVLHIPFVLEPFRDEEREAKEYAGEFLMPSEDVRPDLVALSYNKLTEIKEYWKTSKAAIIRKAYSLQLINESKYTYLNIELGRRGEKINENGYVDIDSPKLLTSVISLYKLEMGYSVEDLANLTALTTEEFNKYFSEEENGSPKLRRFTAVI